MRLARRLGIFAGAVTLVVSMAAGGGRAGAVSGAASGYWTLAQTNGGQVPTPPNVPAGGMWISSNTATALAVAAVRVTLDTGEAPPVIISLHVASESPPGGAAIFACPTTGSWQPAQDGPAANAPAYDCSIKHVVGIHSVDGQRLVFDVSDLATSSGLDIALVPQPATNTLPGAVPPLPAGGPSPSPSPPPVPAPVPAPVPSPTGLPTSPPSTLPALPATPVPAPVSPPSTIPTQANATFDATFAPFTADQVQVLGSTPPTTEVSLQPFSGSDFTFTPPDFSAAVPLASAPSFRSPSTTAAPRRPQVAAPPVRRAAPAARSKVLSGRNRALLGGTLLALMAWELRDELGVRTGGPGLPPLTLYDTPTAEARTTPVREGKPPPIR